MTNKKVNSAIKIIAIILACVAVTAFISIATKNFTNTDFSTNLHPLNEKNLLYGKIKDAEKTTSLSSGLSKTIKNGVITLDGTCRETTVIEPVSITLPAGTYTFSCFDNPSSDCYARLCGPGGNEIVIVDADDFDDSYFDFGRTFTLSAETELTLQLYIDEDAVLKNVKAYPVIVEGDEIGSFYKK